MLEIITTLEAVVKNYNTVNLWPFLLINFLGILMFWDWAELRMGFDIINDGSSIDKNRIYILNLID
jgi:hypothetical protein